MAILDRSIAKVFLKTTVLWCAISVILFSCTNVNIRVAVPYYNTPEFTPIWLVNHELTDTLHTIADFSFTDQNGEKITRSTFKNKIYIADFFFTACPGICPRMATNLKLVYDHFLNNPEVLFISHSVTPERDSVPVLKKYASERGINTNQWHFVTGNESEIYTIARKSYFVEQQIGFAKDTTEFLHTENFILVDRNGHIRGIFNGTQTVEADRIIADINNLLKEN